MPALAVRCFAVAALIASCSVASAQNQREPPSMTVVLPPAAGGPAVAPQPSNPLADKAFGAYQRGYFFTALREATARVNANPNDAPAMTLIGEIYRDGVAVKRDYAEAARWYRLAAGLGNREAEFQLGMMLLTGAEGVPVDRPGAIAALEKASAQNHSGALYNLGVIALEGEGGDASKADFAKAADLFHRAAEAGDANAAYSYGVLLRQGRGVPLDIGEAAIWLQRAAEGGIIAGEVEYAIMLFNGIGVDKDEEAAAKLFLKAAAQNNPIAQNRLAHIYATGRGAPKDLVKAAMWHRFAKASGIEDKDLDDLTATLGTADLAKVDALVRRQVGM